MDLKLFYLIIVISINNYCCCARENSDLYELFENDLNIRADNVAILIEDSLENFKRALSFLKSEESLQNSNLWLITFNSSGVSGVLEENRANLYNFIISLNFYANQISNLEKSANNSLLLFALLHTSQILPNNSAIAIFTKGCPSEDTYLEKSLINIISNKNITIYTSVTDNKKNDLLKKIREYSGGKKLNIVIDVNNNNISDLNNGTVLLKNNTGLIINSVEINKFDNNNKSIYDLIKNKTMQENSFQRFSNIFFRNEVQQSITVDVAAGSELIINSNHQPEIYFEVTNWGSNAEFLAFSCSGLKRILHRLSDYRKYLESQQSTLIKLILNTGNGAYTDEITFIVRSNSQTVQKKIYVDVGRPIIDENSPIIDYWYTSDCTEVIFSQCSKGSWTIQISARDPESGLLQLNSWPKGLYFPYSYTSGTRESVSAQFSDSCCRPKLEIFAIDRLNNKISYTVNAYHAKLSAGVIAAIVLGILIFLILISVLIYFIVIKVRQKGKFILPTYKGGRI